MTEQQRKIQTATVVEILPTRIWIENDFMGNRHVMMQHEGLHEFTYATFGYDYAYTSNSGTHAAAHALAIALGAAEPVEERTRDLPPWPSADELREQIEGLKQALAAVEADGED